MKTEVEKNIFGDKINLTQQTEGATIMTHLTPSEAMNLAQQLIILAGSMMPQNIKDNGRTE
jgi:hypothetical protein